MNSRQQEHQNFDLNGGLTAYISYICIKCMEMLEQKMTAAKNVALVME